MSLTEVPLGDVADLVRGITFPTSAKKRGAGKGLIPCLRTTNVQDAVEWDDLIYVPDEHVRSEAQRVRVGDILVSMSNSLELVGKCALVTHVPTPATFGAFIAVVRAREGIDPEYVFHAMRSPKFKAHIRRVASTTTNISNINSTKLLASKIVLAGDMARKGIVSKIDELFSRIDEGERALERVSTLVERYRQSVLKAAVTGELTRGWREARKAAGHLVETGEALLTRILTARREAWEQAELSKMQAKGITSKDDAWKQKYNEPSPPDSDDLPELPDGWAWASMDQLLVRIEAGKSFKCEERPPASDEFGIVKVSAVTWGTYDESESKTITDKSRIRQAYLIREGDFLFSRANTIELVGACVIAGEPRLSLLLSDKVLRFIFALDLKVWADVVLKSRFGRSQIEELSTGNQESMRNIGQERIGKIVVPLPPPAEIDAITDRVAVMQQRALQMLDSAYSERRRCSALRQAILRVAFAGHLISQDPRDEPASTLLERIAAERAKPNGAAPKRGRKKKSA